MIDNEGTFWFDDDHDANGDVFFHGDETAIMILDCWCRRHRRSRGSIQKPEQRQDDLVVSPLPVFCGSLLFFSSCCGGGSYDDSDTIAKEGP
jgi:hypothetical protein